MNLLRAKSVVAAALVAVVALGGCSILSNSPAATVNGAKISDGSLQDELSAIRDNKTYRDLVEQGMQAAQAGEAPGTFDTTFIARLLTQRVYYELIEGELARRKAKIVDAELTAVRSVVIEQVGGKKVFESFADGYQDQLVRQRALFKKLNDVFAEDVLKEEVGKGGPEAYFKAHADEFVQGCASHILVSSQDKGLEAARAEAAALKARLDKGADFATLAKESSSDTGSAQQGGDLGCVGKGKFVPEFEEALFSLPIGQVSDPIQTQFGFHLILVRERRTPTYEEAKTDVAAVINGLSSRKLEKFLVTASGSAKVSVDKRYGKWEIQKGATDGTPDGVGIVVPPKGPTTTTTTAKTGAGSLPSGAPDAGPTETPTPAAP